jgi:DNA recombination protein RmuC
LFGVNSLILPLFLLVFLLAAGVIFLLIQRRGKGGDQTQLSELVGRLAQMAESQTSAQTHLSDRLQAQERALSKTLEERLSAVTHKVGESLEKTSQRSHASMVELHQRLAVIDAAQKNITELSTQVVGLQDILSNKQARGAFGEIQLQDLVTNVLPASAYGFQETLSNGKRVDCLIRLPNPPGPIAIDAKFPLESFTALGKAEDEAARKAAIRMFGTDIKKHVRDIAEKYLIPGETAESALMFLPSEAVYAEIQVHLPEIVEFAFRSRVVIVSPSTLWATLNTIRAVLKDVRMREQAGLIQKEVHVLMEDVMRLCKRIDSLDSHFHQAEKDIREIRTSTDKISKRGERITLVEMAENEGDGEPPLLIPPEITPES